MFQSEKENSKTSRKIAEKIKKHKEEKYGKEIKDYRSSSGNRANYGWVR